MLFEKAEFTLATSFDAIELKMIKRNLLDFFLYQYFETLILFNLLGIFFYQKLSITIISLSSLTKLDPKWLFNQVTCFFFFFLQVVCLPK